MILIGLLGMVKCFQMVANDLGMESVFYGFEKQNIMTKEQHQEFIEFALELKWNRDAYSRARIIEELMYKVDELVKNCSIPAVMPRFSEITTESDDKAFSWVLKNDKNADYPENNSDMIRRLVHKYNNLIKHLNGA